MKRKYHISSLMIACLALTTLVRADDPIPASRQATHADSDLTLAHMAPTKLNKASVLIGTKVKNLQGDTLGEIEDIVVDLAQGKVSYVVLASGGVLGIAEKRLAVPLTAFSRGTDEDHLVLQADKDSIARAEGIKDQWPSVQNPSFGAMPFWHENHERDMDTHPANPLEK